MSKKLSNNWSDTKKLVQKRLHDVLETPYLQEIDFRFHASMEEIPTLEIKMKECVVSVEELPNDN